MIIVSRVSFQKTFLVKSDDHLYTVCRYVELKPLRANLIQRAGPWHWSSLWRRSHGDDEPRRFLAPWPLLMPLDWAEYVNMPQIEAELEAVRRSVQRGCPFGSSDWREQMAALSGLGHTLRPQRRPEKAPPQKEPTP